MWVAKIGKTLPTMRQVSIRVKPFFQTILGAYRWGGYCGYTLGMVARL